MLLRKNGLDLEARREEYHVKMEVETDAMFPQVKEC